MTQHNVLYTPIEYLKGVGPIKGTLLKKELDIHCFRDLLFHFPLRYIDKTKVSTIRSIQLEDEQVQIIAQLLSYEIMGKSHGKRLVAKVKDKTGMIEVVWFQGIDWIQKQLQVGQTYILYGKINLFQSSFSLTHPEIELYVPEEWEKKRRLEPVYSSTEKLKAKGLGPRHIGKLIFTLYKLLPIPCIAENLPVDILQRNHLLDRDIALRQIHFPDTIDLSQEALNRWKFEELFIAQWKLQHGKLYRMKTPSPLIMNSAGGMARLFCNSHLPFQLTGSQKKVIKDIAIDMKSGYQMNRLLQGDVGSGKTMVALITMLLAIDNGYQSALMVPTEILAQQHFSNIQKLLAPLNIRIALLTGSIKQKEKKIIYQRIKDNLFDIVIGTHALIEDNVQFGKLGLIVIDEQHRFGVEQRSLLWKKYDPYPHILIMTATPIPRTLALTQYGDLDCSILKDMPPGRSPIRTYHYYDTQRYKVMELIRQQIDLGKQAYIVYPLIDENEKMPYEDLKRGYEEVVSYFPANYYRVSMLHGKMSKELKETNMRRFMEGNTQIMVSTTVIEVGVDIPNATVMLIESADKFGLAQLHQLRGRVGRGKDLSYCFLLTSFKISNETKQKLNTLCMYSSGFDIAEKDMDFRGPGDLGGTQQSGALPFKLASVTADYVLVELAYQEVVRLLNADPDLLLPENRCLHKFINLYNKNHVDWSQVS